VDETIFIILANNQATYLAGYDTNVELPTACQAYREGKK
jgi:hypothetical protein